MCIGVCAVYFINIHGLVNQIHWIVSKYTGEPHENFRKKKKKDAVLLIIANGSFLIVSRKVLSNHKVNCIHCSADALLNSGDMFRIESL